jgi:tetratricopeptide (TPR) repeat protein
VLADRLTAIGATCSSAMATYLGHFHQALTAFLRSDFERAGTLLYDTLALTRQTELADREAIISVTLSSVKLAQGDHAAALELCDRCLASPELRRNRFAVADAHHVRGLALYALGERVHAAESFRSGLAAARAIALTTDTVALALFGYALSTASSDESVSARVLGAAEALADYRGMRIESDDEEEIQRACLSLQAALGEEGFARARLDGRMTPIDEIVAEILSEEDVLIETAPV